MLLKSAILHSDFTGKRYECRRGEISKNKASCPTVSKQDLPSHPYGPGSLEPDTRKSADKTITQPALLTGTSRGGDVLVNIWDNISAFQRCLNVCNSSQAAEENETALRLIWGYIYLFEVIFQSYDDPRGRELSLLIDHARGWDVTRWSLQAFLNFKNILRPRSESVSNHPGEALWN